MKISFGGREIIFSTQKPFFEEPLSIKFNYLRKIRFQCSLQKLITPEKCLFVIPPTNIHTLMYCN